MFRISELDTADEIHTFPFYQRSAGNAVSVRFDAAVSLLKNIKVRNLI